MSVPGYFPPMKVGNKVLVSGSFGDTVNPSYAAFIYLRDSDRRFSEDNIEWVNLGANSILEGSAESKPQKRGTSLITRIPLTDMLKRLREYQGSAPESVAMQMQHLARTHPSNQISFTRFSVDFGEPVVEWDEYKAMYGLLEQRTISYLAQKEVSERLQQTAKRLAQHCRPKQAKARQGSD